MNSIQFEADGRGHLALAREQPAALPRYERDKLADLGRQHGFGDGLQLLRDWSMHVGLRGDLAGPRHRLTPG